LEGEQARKVFEQILADTRQDLVYIAKLYSSLENKITNNGHSKEISRWIIDVFIDKIYEFVVKMNSLFNHTIKEAPVNTNSVSEKLISSLHGLAYAKPKEVQGYLHNVESLTKVLAKWVEWDSQKCVG
jgi:hypothetical protein